MPVVVSWRSTVTPGARSRRRTPRPCGCPSSPAPTRSRVEPAGTQVFVPSSTQPEPFFARGRRRRLRGRAVFDECRRWRWLRRLTSLGQPRALQRIVAELRRSAGCPSPPSRGTAPWRPVRPTSSSTSATSRKPRPAPPCASGAEMPIRPASAKRGPRLAIEPLAVGFELFVALGRHQIGRGSGGPAIGWPPVLRSVRNPSVPPHRSDRGMPKPNIAIRSRCSSLVPPPNVKINKPRYALSSRDCITEPVGAGGEIRRLADDLHQRAQRLEVELGAEGLRGRRVGRMQRVLRARCRRPSS